MMRPHSILLLTAVSSTMAAPNLDVNTHHVLTALPSAITTVAADIQPSLASSYSVGDACYCLSTFPVDTPVLVDTPFGKQTVGAACSLIGPGPGVNSDSPLYNDPQCGNGLPITTDDALCPGRVDHGVVGCRYIGPKWNFTEQLAYNSGTCTNACVLDIILAVLSRVGLACLSPSLRTPLYTHSMRHNSPRRYLGRQQRRTRCRGVRFCVY